ncbi:hypothetical protein ACSZN2_19630, partial [Aeromonas hydrophila]|uniref:hypothetical protein n=1 Tax=Aeromonas hydrophila TaxID=644 RepID=UPI003EC93CF4
MRHCLLPLALTGLLSACQPQASTTPSAPWNEQENGPVEYQCKQQHQQQIHLHHTQGDAHNDTPT